MRVYKVIGCYIGDDVQYFIFPYHVSLGQIRYMGIVGFIKYLLNGSLTMTIAERKLVKMRNKRLQN